jgi:chromosome partitioning protein
MPNRTGPTTWAFLNAKGGTGKTTLAVHAAVWHARRGAHVVLVDADAQQASSTWLAEVQQPGLQVMAAADADALHRAVDASRRVADVVLVDGPAGLSDVTRAALIVTDLAVLPVGPSAVDLRGALQAVNLVLDARQVRGSLLPAARLVLNRVQPWTTLGADAAAAIRHQQVPGCRAMIPQRTCLADSSGQATTVFDMSGPAAAAAADDLNALFLELSRCRAAGT